MRQKTVRSSVWVAMSSIGLGSLSFVKSIILARLLAPEHFGLMAICMVVMRALQVFTETGLGSALIQRQGDVEQAKHTVYSLTAFRGVLLALIVLATSSWVAGFYEQPSLKPLLDVLAISLLLGGLGNINFVLAQKELNFRPQFYLTQSLGLIDSAVTILLAFWLRNAWALIIGHVVKTVVSIPLSYLLLPGRPRFAWNPRLVRELLRYGKYISGITIVVYVTTEIDNAVIGKILGMDALGAYVLAYMLANLPATHLAKVIASVMFPAYSKLQDDRPALHRAYLQTTRMVATLAIPAAVGIAVLARELVTIVFGPNWNTAADVLPVLCVFGALRAVSAINGYVFNAVGKPHFSFYMNLAKLIIIAVIIVPATRSYGMLGAAIAVTAPSAVMFLISELVFSKSLQLPLRKMVGAILPAIAASGTMGLALALGKRWLSVETPVALTVTVVMAVILYGALNRSGLQAVIGVFSKR
ncbi:MAG: lipopolysaccharide biosynthesis protein [Steroidobacteraceae bacterium]